MYNKKSHIHFIGIGGIGMSGIATILKHQGYQISGCDTDLDQPSVQKLHDLSCTVFKGNNTAACHDTSIDILVYSSAIKANNPEIIAAQNRGIPTIPRALMLAELMRTKYSVAIAGSHGKTTTTSIISHILIEAGIDPTVIVGGHLKTISNNARHGDSDFLIAEADESDRSLLHLHATLAIVTNIDLEHLETYRDLEDIKDTFKQFLSHLPFYGRAILCMDDENIQSILPIPHIKTVLYGLNPHADWSASDIDLQPDHSIFTLNHKASNTSLPAVRLNVPGKHNILNTLASIALAHELGVSLSAIQNALASFKGVERRFSYQGLFHGAELFDDYGHHPKEIACTLDVARRRAKKNITVVFQPHRYTRTQKLWNDFIETFLSSGINNLIITDIYAASETPIQGITAQDLVTAIKQLNPSFTVNYVPFENDFNLLKKKIIQLSQPDDLVLLQGAGKLNKLALPAQDL